MLEELLIRGVGIIDEVTLDLAPGLTVLTGETGAGKTMVVSALELLLGARADAERVRAGAGSARVEGRFRPPPPASGEWLDEGDDELVVSREVTVDEGASRSRARLGGRLAPVSALAEVLTGVVEVHGQQETARLAQPAVQRDLLDRWGAPDTLDALDAYRRAFQDWRACDEELEALRAGDRERAREVDRLRFELGEIDAVEPRAGEEAGLEAELRRLEHAEALRDAAAAGAAAIVDDGGARDVLGVVVGMLRGVAGHDEALDTLLARAESLAAEAQDLALDLGAYRDVISLDPERLEERRARQAALAGLCRKYGASAEAVVAYAAEARSRLAVLEGGSERLAELDAVLPRLRDDVDAAALRLRAAREEAGRRLAETVDGHLAELAMAGARMTVALEPTEPGPYGADRVQLLLAAGEGEPSLPVGRAASGGERSRIALALRLALADADETPVLVFDEVDAGIGGATAVAVGRKLARLAHGRGGRQVLCVTHLAQLAASADTHLVVAKGERAGRVEATVRPLDEAERVAELSRMLSGTDTEAAATHAAELRAAALEVAGRAGPVGSGGDACG